MEVGANPLATLHSEALREVVNLARDLQLSVDRAVLLRSTNNLVAWLAPSPVVAKIGISRDARLRLELDVAKELHALEAPIAPPAAEVPVIVHRVRDVEVTFWRFYAQDPSV